MSITKTRSGPREGDCSRCVEYQAGGCRLGNDPGWPSCKYVVIECPACLGEGTFTSETGEYDHIGYFVNCDICKGKGKVAPNDIPYCDRCKSFAAFDKSRINAVITKQYPGDKGSYDGYCNHPNQHRFIGDAHCLDGCKDYTYKL